MTESWRGLLADTSQSSFESGGSPSQRLLHEEYQRESAMLHSSQGTSVDAYSSSPTPGMVRHPLRRADLHRLRGHATHRHPLMTDMMATSLPSKYDEEDYHRPSFRKSASQPTRSMSPALSLRSPTEPPGHSSSMAFSSTAHAAAWTTSKSAAFYSKKRQLPQVPMTGRSSRDQLNYAPQMYPGTTGIPFDPNEQLPPPQRTHHPYRSHFTRTSSGDSMTPQGMYSDSEITARPSYSTEKLFYAHPTHRPMSTTAHRDRRSKSSVSRSVYSPETESPRGAIIDSGDRDRDRGIILGADGSTVRKGREDVRRESVEFIPRRSRIREKTRFESEREKGPDEGSETSSRISVTEAASAAGSAGSSTRTAVSSAKTKVKSTTPARFVLELI